MRSWGPSGTEKHWFGSRCIPFCVTLRSALSDRIACQPPDALEILVQVGALDVETVGDGLAAILPDTVTPDTVARSLGVAGVTVSPAVARDSDSVWLLSPRAVRIGSMVIAPPEMVAPSGALRLRDSMLSEPDIIQPQRCASRPSKNC